MQTHKAPNLQAKNPYFTILNRLLSCFLSKKIKKSRMVRTIFFQKYYNISQRKTLVGFV